jgi:hypothetical protein
MPGADRAASLYEAARRAERRGDLVEAYLKASQAVALAPHAAEYWNYSQALRTRALAALAPSPAQAVAPQASEEATLAPEFVITAEELLQARQLRPPPLLEGDETVQSFRLREPAKRLIEQVARAYGIDVVFDPDYSDGPPIRFELARAGWREALRAAEAVTGSFFVALEPRRAMVAKDTPEKRRQLEPVMNLLVPLPETLKDQDVQEAVRAVQTAMDLTKVGIDLKRRLVLFRDRVSRLRPAVLLFEQLAMQRAQVTIEVELIAITDRSDLSAGLRARSSWPLAFAANPTPFAFQPQTDPARMAVFGGGDTRIAITVIDGELFAALAHGQSRTLQRSLLRTLDGEPATLQLGDRYPVLTAGFFGPSDAGGYRPPPTVNFEDLGVTLKVTPRVHNAREVTLEMEAEFKSLTGEAFNGIPVISQRRFASRLRAAFSETVLVAGVGSESFAQSWSGLPLLSLMPGLRSGSRALERTQLLLAVRPRLESLPPVESPVWTLRTGSEARPLTPLE